MPVTVKAITTEVERLAPMELVMNGDNCGLLVGGGNRDVSRVLIALDVTDAVIDEAIERGAQLIVTHHPLIYTPISRINDDDYTGGKIVRLIKNDISYYAAHSNLDASDYGTNATLCAMLKLKNIEPIIYEGTGAMGRTGTLPAPVSPHVLAQRLGELLQCGHVRLSAFTGHTIEKIAICTGAGSKVKYFKEAVSLGCQCYITGDTRYHELQEAQAMKLTVIDATHYATELPVINVLYNKLSAVFDKSDVTFMQSQSDGQVYREI